MKVRVDRAGEIKKSDFLRGPKHEREYRIAVTVGGKIAAAIGPDMTGEEAHAAIDSGRVQLVVLAPGHGFE